MVRGGPRQLLAREEDGFTLPEVLVAMTMTVAVLFALYAIFDASVRVWDAGGAEIEAVENARLGLERMEREIRAAHPRDGGVLLESGDADSVVFYNKPDTGAPARITYAPSAGSPKFLLRNGVRVAGPLAGSDGLRLSYCTTTTACSPTIAAEDRVRLVRVTLDVRVRGVTDATRTLSTGVYLRNRG